MTAEATPVEALTHEGEGQAPPVLGKDKEMLQIQRGPVAGACTRRVPQIRRDPAGPREALLKARPSAFLPVEAVPVMPA